MSIDRAGSAPAGAGRRERPGLGVLLLPPAGAGVPSPQRED